MPESPVLPGAHCCFSRGAALPMFILAPPVSGSVSAGSVSHLGRTGGFGCLNCLPPRTMSGFVGRGRVLITCYFSSLMWAHAAVKMRTHIAIVALYSEAIRIRAPHYVAINRHAAAASAPTARRVFSLTRVLPGPNARAHHRSPTRPGPAIVAALYFSEPTTPSYYIMTIYKPPHVCIHSSHDEYFDLPLWRTQSQNK